MGRLESVAAAGAAVVTLLLGGLGVEPAAVAASATLAAPDALEPANSALRLKQFADAAGRLAREPLASDPRAQYLLGTLYLAGLGVGEDSSRARALFTGAAARGEPRAAFALAALDAHDAPVDEAGARSWLAKAAAACHADAIRLLQAGRLPLQVDSGALATDPTVTLAMTIAVARRNDAAALASLWQPAVSGSDYAAHPEGRLRGIVLALQPGRIGRTGPSLHAEGK